MFKFKQKKTSKNNFFKNNKYYSIQTLFLCAKNWLRFSYILSLNCTETHIFDNVFLRPILKADGDLVVTSPRELVEIPGTLVRFSLSFPEEDLCPVHEFSWWSLGRNVVGRQMMCRKAMEGSWLTLDHADRLKFQSRLARTCAIVIGRYDGLSSTSHSVTIQMRFLASWGKTTGWPEFWGRAPLIRVVGFVGAFSTSARQWWT